MHPRDTPEISKLSVPEKILLIEELWDEVATDESAVPFPQSHKDELDRRMEKYNASPGNLLSLEQLQASVENRK